MLFNSWSFFLFFPVVTALFFMLPHRGRWLMLLIASCIFYMAFVPAYIFVLAAVIIVDYSAAIWIEKSQGRTRNLYLIGSIVFTCLILFFFKYFDFFAVNVTSLAQLIGWNYSVSVLEILLPIGLSFHTFQSLSYVIEVHRGNQKPEKHFGIYALYVMFYPQLVAGPIERPQNLLPQFHEKHVFNYNDAVEGLKLIACGLFKKVVIADRLALFVNPVYDNPTQYDGFALIVATIFFTFQVFCDFSGYSDIARGSARVMGFKLMLNFDRPYSAKTLSEFWKRWHISLSTWLRDYIYEPLVLKFRHAGTAGIILAIMLTFLASGFWHGASWTFVIWGLLHGAMLSIEVILAKPRKRLSKMLPTTLFNGISIFITFSFVSFSYIFFRAKTLEDALYIIHQILSATYNLFPLPLAHFRIFRDETIPKIYGTNIPTIFESILTTSPARMEFILSIALIVLLMGTHILQKHYKTLDVISARPWWVRWPTYQAAAFSLVFLGIWFVEKRDFIYFQF